MSSCATATSSLRTAAADCRKFAPNIFNKSKCSNCFRQKEEHSVQALECNRASRKVTKCGYLFVAPGWDFSDPLNRTKRWQRRWFVLYDDGELNYSVDEHPDTVPQAVVDMTQVLEVASAEEVTGHAHSLALTAPDRVHFVRAACREEARWWADLLTVFTRSKGRHKRNATFPGGQSTTMLPTTTPIMRSGTPSAPRPRYNSCHTDSETPPYKWRNQPSPLQNLITTSKDIPTKDTIDSSSMYKDHPISSASPPTRDKINSDEKAKCRQLQREKLMSPIPLSSVSAASNLYLGDQHNDVSSLLMSANQNLSLSKSSSVTSTLSSPAMREVAERDSTPQLPKSQSPQQQIQTELNNIDSKKLNQITIETTIDRKYNNSTRGSPDGALGTPLTSTEQQQQGWLSTRSSGGVWSRHWFALRGAALTYCRDPRAGILDGVIDLNGVTAVEDVRVEQSFGFQLTLWDTSRFTLSAATADIRNGWISVLRRVASLPEIPSKNLEILPSMSILSRSDKESHGSIPNTPMTPLTPRSTMFSSDDEYRTASEGHGRRESSDWGDIGLPICGLPPSPPLTRTALSRVKERARSRSSSGSRRGCKRSRSSPPSSRRSTLDSDEIEIHTNQLKHIDICSDHLEQLSDTSNILNIQVENEQDQRRNSSSNFHLNNLDRSDCSDCHENELEQHNKLNSIRSDHFKAPEDLKSNSLHLKSQINSNYLTQIEEIESLKKQLKIAMNDISDMEQEVIKLRQVKTEATLQEKRMEELLTTLELTERQLNERSENIDLLKRMYNKDKEMWEQKISESETMLKDATERCRTLNDEVIIGRNKIEKLENELSNLSERLSRGIDENDALYKRIQELEQKSFKLTRGRSVDSLSDLTNIDLDKNLHELDKERVIEEYDELRHRFEKAINEILAMKRELREAHASYDDLEIANLTLRQEMKMRSENDKSQLNLMVARVQDLTIKLSMSERQVRSLKQKLQDSREKRRSLSLKGRESVSIGKEVEEKIAELENKLIVLESGTPEICKEKINLRKSPKRELPDRNSPTEERKLRRMQARLRRKSLDSATSSEPMKLLIKLCSLESKVSNIAEVKKEEMGTSTESISQTSLNDNTLESDSVERLHELENIILSAKNKVTECLCQISLLKTPKSKRSSSPQIEKRNQEGVQFLEKCLLDLGNLLNKSHTTNLNNSELCIITDSVKTIVVKLEKLLRSKLTDIVNRRTELLKRGELDEKKKQELLAEKLAYEAVIISRIHDALNENKILKSQILETSHLLSNLKHKLNGKSIKHDNEINSSVENLTHVLASKLIKSGQVLSVTSQEINSEKNSDKILEYLCSKRDEIETKLLEYKTKKMNQLAYALAAETLSYLSDNDNIVEKLTPDDSRLKSAWQIAQETVNNELIQSEIIHVMLRCAQIYDPITESDTVFSLYASERANLELWMETVSYQLKTEMQQNITVLIDVYEKQLNNLKTSCSSYSDLKIKQEDKMVETRKLLSEFADICAHKALLDSRIMTLTKNYVPQNMLLEDLKDNEEINLLDFNSVLDAEFQFLFQKFSKECITKINDVPISEKSTMKNIFDTVVLIENEINVLNKYIEHKDTKIDDKSNQNIEILSWEEISTKCTEIYQKFVGITDILKEECDKCKQLQNKLQIVNSEHEETMNNLKHIQEQNLNELKNALETERNSQLVLKERAKKLEQRLGTLDSEYAQQVENLREAYNQMISSAGLSSPNSTGEEGLRHRYQAEIEQLRALCEKGLIAMESSHRRVVAELEERHRREKEKLRHDKEAALAEETQATLAALDAMRKAHEAQVRREVAQFKADFVKKMQSTSPASTGKDDMSSREHEEEMDEIRKEILSLSEKYSIKCVESAALEEELAKTTSQLTQAQQRIAHLDARNKQLRLHLMSDTTESDSRLQSINYNQKTMSPTVRPTLEANSAICKNMSVARSPRSRQLSPLQN